MIRLLHDAPAPGARNMAVDEALMASARNGVTTVRFYQWEPGCLSFGRNQLAVGRYDPEAARDRGIEIVRRPTGGRTVYHHRELTYSVTAPARAWGSLPDAYCRINHALACGLQALGAPVACAAVRAARGDRSPAPRPDARACFRDPLPGEVTALGRKLVGSAQWRNQDALLQHGSILLVNEQRVTEELRTGDEDRGAPARSDAHTGAIGLGDLLSALPSIDEIVEALAGGFAKEFATSVEQGHLETAEVVAVEDSSGRYADPEWTWRR